MKIRTVVLATIVGLGSPAVASAHHAFSAEYDINQELEIEGVVTKVEWTNPHVRFYLDVEDEEGNVANWDLELQSANTLARAGWSRRALNVGDQLIVSVFLAKDGSQRGNARGNVRLANGNQLFAGDPPTAADR